MPTLCPVLSCAVCSVIRCSIIYCEGSNKIQVRHITCPGRKNHLPSMPLHSHHIRPPLNKWSPHDYFLLEFGYIIPSRCTHKSCLMLSRRSLLKIVNSCERNRAQGLHSCLSWVTVLDEHATLELLISIPSNFQFHQPSTTPSYLSMPSTRKILIKWMSCSA